MGGGETLPHAHPCCCFLIMLVHHVYQRDPISRLSSGTARKILLKKECILMADKVWQMTWFRLPTRSYHTGHPSIRGGSPHLVINLSQMTRWSMFLMRTQPCQCLIATKMANFLKIYHDTFQGLWISKTLVLYKVQIGLSNSSDYWYKTKLKLKWTNKTHKIP